MKSFLYYIYTDSIKVFPTKLLATSTSATPAAAEKKASNKEDMAKLRDMALSEQEWELGKLSLLAC